MLMLVLNVEYRMPEAQNFQEDWRQKEDKKNEDIAESPIYQRRATELLKNQNRIQTDLHLKLQDRELNRTEENQIRN